MEVLIKDLNKEELIIGAMASLVFFYWIGPIVILMAPITGFLWALTGSRLSSNSKLWRRLGVPLIVAVGLYYATKNWHVFLAIPAAFGILSLGYGIPDSTDKGSWLARLWIKIGIHEDHLDLFVRTTIYVLFFVAFLICIYWR